MTETTLSKPVIVNTIFTKEYPVSFRITDEKHEERLYLENEPTSGLLELTNNSGHDIYFIPSAEPSKIAGPDNFHFALKFRPGILQTTIKSLIRNKLIKKGWALSIGLVSLQTGKVEDEKMLINEDVQPDEVTSVLYFLNTNKAKFGHGKSITLPLKHLHLDCEQGTQVTKVELFCNGLASDKEYKDRIKSRLRHYDLTIINHRGSAHMPVQIGFTGFNAILNDGSANQLTLRITNLQRKTPESDGTLIFSYRKHSKIYLYFKTDLQPGSDALGTANNVAEIGLRVINPHQKGNYNLVHEALFQGDNPIWEIFPDDGDVILQPHLEKPEDPVPGRNDDSSMDIILSNLITTFPSGVTHVYLRFENIPDYWDRTFSIPLLKQPLIINGDKVGIGIANPDAKLGVKGGNIGVDEGGQNNGTTNYGIRFGGPASEEFIGSKRTAGGNQNGLDLFTKNQSRLSILNNGNVGIGTTSPAAQLAISSGASTALRIDANANVSALNIGGTGDVNVDAPGITGGRFTIKNNGNIGIGTASPTEKLHINNFSNPGPAYLEIASSGVKAGPVGQKIAGIKLKHFNEDYGFTIESLDDNSGPPSGLYVKSHQNSPQGQTRLYIDRYNGNIGMGTDKPNQKTEIGANGGLGFAGTGLNSADKKLYSPADGDLEWMTHDQAGVHGFAVSHQGTKKVYLNTSGYSYLNGGNVGIGTSAPEQGKLVVTGNVLYTIPTYHWMNNNNHGQHPVSAMVPISIYASNRIVCDEFNAVSDERIKNIKGRSESGADLQVLLSIEVTDYSYKDVVSKGNTTYKKVIAQQVEKNYPGAVHKHTDAIPDIYQPALIGNGWVKLATDLVSGEKVQLIFGSERKVVEVLETKAGAFKVTVDKDGDVFVYGRQVDDVLSVDYEAISMLNVSATQELSKQVEILKSENQRLKTEQEKMQKEIVAIKEMMRMKMELIAD